MRVSNAVFFFAISLCTAMLAGLTGWFALAAKASGFISHGRFSGMISRAIDPASFQEKYQSYITSTVILSIFSGIFLVSSLVSYIKNR